MSTWFPTTRRKTTQQCWLCKSDNTNFLMLLAPCGISLPQKRTSICRQQSDEDILQEREWYKITDETKPSTTKFPFKYVPFLNQTIGAVVAHYTRDPFESRHFGMYIKWQRTMAGLEVNFQEAFANTSFDTIKEYETIYTDFEDAIKVSVPIIASSIFCDKPHIYLVR